MITVLVANDTVYKQVFAIPLEEKGSRDPLASRSLTTCAMDPMVPQRGPPTPLNTWLALCFLICCPVQALQWVGPTTLWMVGHAAWLLSHFQAGNADGKTAHARQSEKPNESLVQLFAEWVTRKDSTFQLSKSRGSWGYALWLETSETGQRCVARTIRQWPTERLEVWWWP